MADISYRKTNKNFSVCLGGVLSVEQHATKTPSCTFHVYASSHRKNSSKRPGIPRFFPPVDSTLAHPLQWPCFWAGSMDLQDCLGLVRRTLVKWSGLLGLTHPGTCPCLGPCLGSLGWYYLCMPSAGTNSYHRATLSSTPCIPLLQGWGNAINSIHRCPVTPGRTPVYGGPHTQTLALFERAPTRGANSVMGIARQTPNAGFALEKSPFPGA